MARLRSPAAGRNLEPITGILQGQLRGEGAVLEVGSGPGEHIVAWAAAFPDLTWIPSDVSLAARESIAHYRASALTANVRPPEAVDLADRSWGLRWAGELAAIVAVNVLHIAPWEVSLGLLHGAGHGLVAGGQLFIYGPFMRNGAHTSESNERFDRSLREQDARWGVRDAADLERVAFAEGLDLAESHAMPANNRILRFVARS